VKEEIESEDESKEIISVGEGNDSDSEGGVTVSDSDSEGGVTVSDSECGGEDTKPENDSDLEDEEDQSELSDDELVKGEVSLQKICSSIINIYFILYQELLM
jgi:hypothetical protein